MTCHYTDLGSTSDWSCHERNVLEIWVVNVTSMEFLCLSSDVILRRDQWWHHEVSTVFSGLIVISNYFLLTSIQSQQTGRRDLSLTTLLLELCLKTGSIIFLIYIWLVQTIWRSGVQTSPRLIYVCYGARDL